MATASHDQLRQTLAFVCSSLRVIGLSGLTPEVIKQAYFAGPVVGLQGPGEQKVLLFLSTCMAKVSPLCLKNGVLGRALHDLVILSLADFPDSADCLLQDYWKQIEHVHEQPSLPMEGMDVIDHFVAHAPAAH